LDRGQQRQSSSLSSENGSARSEGSAQTLEQIRQRAREDWIRMRRNEERSEGKEHSLDDKDLSM
jgi:hypothetical protein